MQRYDIEDIGRGYMTYREMVEASDGEYVRYDDHAALCKAVEDYCAEVDNPAPDFAHRKRLRNHMLNLAKDGHDESQ